MDDDFFKVVALIIFSKAVHDIIKLILDHIKSYRVKTDRADVSALEGRMKQMEERIITLQNIVIGGEYEVVQARKRLEQAQMQGEAPAYASKPSTVQTLTASGES